MDAAPFLQDRRTFLKAMASATTGVMLSSAFAIGEAAKTSRIKLGLDNFSVRAMGWKAPALLDYAASLKLDCILISDLDAYESLEDKHLAEVKAKARDLGVQIHAGTWSICPTSKAFKNKWGTADEHLALGLRVANALGSPVLRCVLGTGDDRKTPGGIEARIEDTAKVLKAGRSRALDLGVKIAVENHAGDMQAWELVQLIEAAGKDFVGATMDSGNATWALEDPLTNLEILGPYTLTTGMRDSVMWESEDGARVQWTAMGEGLVDWKKYFARYAELCPQAPVILEIISGFSRPYPYLKENFWDAWPKAKAKDLSNWLALAKRGKELPSHRSANSQEEQQYQRAELERSVNYCREKLGLGVRGA
jgi:3-oxoisoapionate decarboxylase